MPGVPDEARTPTETAVVRAWTAVLGTEPRSTADDFFELGGQSLQLVHFLQFVHERFGVDLDITQLFLDGFTVANTAAVLDEQIRAEQAGTGPRPGMLAEVE
jgi:hypothetical protein